MNLKSLEKEPTCFKNPNNPFCIDLFPTNTFKSFQEAQVFETGLSNFNKLVLTVLKSTFPKSPSKIITYKTFQAIYYEMILKIIWNQNKISLNTLTRFTKIFVETRNKHARIKKNILAQTTQILLQKAYGTIMLRSRLWNSFLKEKYLKSKKAYNKQRNICVKIFK